MKIAWALSVVVAGCIVVSSARSVDDQQAAKKRYMELAAQVRAGDLNIDWQVFRVAAVLGFVGENEDEFQETKDGYEALGAGRFEDALKSAREVEEHNLANVDAHFLAWQALDQLGRKDEAERERKILAAIVQSIMSTGDGKSAKTAWFAATIREEYVMMQVVLRVELVSQHSQRVDGHYFDVVVVKDEKGKERTLWFNTDTDFQRMDVVTERFKEKETAK